jgi:hypothetical protein
MQAANGPLARPRRCCEDVSWTMMAVWFMIGLVTLAMFGLFFLLVARIVARQ